MEEHYRSTSTIRYLLGLATFGMLGWLLLSTAGPASAVDSRMLAGTFVDEGPLLDGPGYVIYVPTLVRRWPPLPYAGAFDVPDSPVWDSPITLSWEARVPLDHYPIDGYLLEESRTPDFAGAVTYDVPVTSVPFDVPPKPFGTMGTYYYRVRARNLWGLGEASNPASVLLLSTRDDFSHPQTGWAPRRTSYWDLGVMAAEYSSGELITRVEDRFDFTIFSPMRSAPPTPYSIKLRTKVIHEANLTSYGIVFGGNEGTFCGVNRWNASDPDGCFSHYYRLNVIWGGYLKYGVARIDGHRDAALGATGAAFDWGYDTLEGYEGGAYGWNEWEIRVYDNGFAVYVNGRLMRTLGDTTYIHDPLYGIFSSTNEYNGARFRHDYYYVEPLVGASATLPAELLRLSAPDGSF